MTKNTTTPQIPATERINKPLPSYLHNSSSPHCPAEITSSGYSSANSPTSSLSTAKPATLDAIQAVLPDLWDLVKRLSTVKFEQHWICNCSICTPIRMELEIVKARACFLVEHVEARR